MIVYLFYSVVFLSYVHAQQRWYLTGDVENGTIAAAPFRGVSVPIFPDGEEELFFGNVRSFANENVSDILVNSTMEVLYGAMESSNNNYEVRVLESSISINARFLTGSKSYEASYGFEVGLYDHRNNSFIKKLWQNSKLGQLVEVQATVVIRPKALTCGKNSLRYERHVMIISTDPRGTALSVNSHVWSPTSPVPFEGEESNINTDQDVSCSAAASNDANGDETSPMASKEPDTTMLKVMTYNLWHNNPPSWVYQYEERSKRYQKRLRHFAQIIIEEDPDVVLLQEVRVDGQFPLPAGATDRRGLSPNDYGAQMEHVLMYIDEMRKSIGNSEVADSPKYQFVYQPAMLLSAVGHQMVARNEEGVAILTKHPVVMKQRNHHHSGDVPAPMSETNTNAEGVGASAANGHNQDHAVDVGVNYRLMPRWLQDKSDDHQRVVLHLSIQLPHPRTGDQGPIVDLYTSHFSLNVRARECGVRDAWKYVLNGQRHSDFQIFGGDFNAEPEEFAIQYLLGNYTDVDDCDFGHDDGAIEAVALSVDGSTAGDDSTAGDELVPVAIAETRPSARLSSPDFVDVWDVTHQRLLESDGLSFEDVLGLGYTFPVCNPVKRIDFLLARNTSANLASDCSVDNSECNESTKDSPRQRWSGTVLGTYLAGSDPTSETASLLVDARPELGMVDKDSPIWASDHKAVISRIRFTTV